MTFSGFPTWEGDCDYTGHNINQSGRYQNSWISASGEELDKKTPLISVTEIWHCSRQLPGQNILAYISKTKNSETRDPLVHHIVIFIVVV